MMDAEETKKRQAAADFSLRAYDKTKGARPYALTAEARHTLAILARAMFERRTAEGRNDLDGKPPSSWQEFSDLIGVLNAAGCNLLQMRPSDPRPLPRVWIDPVTSESLPNPFARGSRNLKAQSLLQLHDPDLAAYYKAMAEDPYGTLIKLKAAETQRQSLASILYGQREHESNPFLGTNETAKGAFVKRDPLLAEFYAEEARPVGIEIFGKNKNQTVVGRLAKDPRTWGLVQRAAQIGSEWQDADKANALKQRAVAEEVLKRLEGSAA
jgi:hypothetical protein